jgi:20S proteasome alpha/beta subunit
MYIMECVGSGITTIKQALENRIEEDLTEYECADFH